MGTLSLFLLKSIVVSGLLTTWYLLGLRGRRLHQYNRFFLLSTLFASLALPFLHFHLFSISHATTGNLAPVALFIQSAGEAGKSMPAIQQAARTQPGWQAVAGIIAACISMSLLLVLLFRILKVRMMSRRYPVTKRQGINLILTDAPSAPFTFLRNLFWNRAIPLEGEVGRLIFRHELTHIEQGHTYDKLVCQVLTCIFWFNPFYWIIQRELHIVHEFIADEHAVSNRDTELFAMMLLRSYNNGIYLVPEHHFFSSTVKRRLTMLQNAAPPSFATLRRFIVLPILAGAILMFSCSLRNGLASNISPAKKKIVILVDAAHGGLDAGGQYDGYMEKEICLRYAQRIKELAPAYNIEVQFTRNNDNYITLAQRVAMSDKVNPDVFISLHVGDEPGKEKEKGDFDIYVSGDNAYATQSSNYSTAIFRAMQQDNIIPGFANTCNHGPDVTCNNCRKPAGNTETKKILSTQKDGIYLLKNTHVPCIVMILGNIKNKEEMQALTGDKQLDMLCNAILKGIVDGATEKAIPRQGCAPSGRNPNPTGLVNFNNFGATLPN